MRILDHSPVQSNPVLMGGILLLSGTRAAVQTMLDYRKDVYSLEEFLDFFPSVWREDAAESLRLVSEDASDDVDSSWRRSSPSPRRP